MTELLFTASLVGFGGLSVGLSRVVKSDAQRIVSGAILIASFLFLLSSMGIQPPELGFAYGSPVRTLLVTLGGTAALISFDIVGLSRVETLSHQALLGVYRTAQRNFGEGQSPALTVVLFLVGAVWEELLYRGAFTLLSRRVFDPGFAEAVAIIIGAAAFAGAHLRSQLADMAYPFMFGLIFAVLYIASGSLLAPIVAHAAGNSFVCFYTRRILKRRVDAKAFFF